MPAQSASERLLRARFSGHRDLAERAEAYRAALQEKRDGSRKQELAVGALAGSALSTPLREAVQYVSDNSLRRRFGNVQLTEPDVHRMVEQGLLPQHFSTQLRNARATPALVSQIAGRSNPEAEEALRRVLAPSKASARASLRIPRTIMGPQGLLNLVARLTGPKSGVSAPVEKFVYRAAGQGAAARLLPLLAAAGAGAAYSQRKYRDLQRTPEELEQKLRVTDIRTMGLNAAAQDVIVPSLASQGVARAVQNLMAGW